jgi:hypothetical protein
MHVGATTPNLQSGNWSAAASRLQNSTNSIVIVAAIRNVGNCLQGEAVALLKAVSRMTCEDLKGSFGPEAPFRAQGGKRSLVPFLNDELQPSSSHRSRN